MREGRSVFNHIRFSRRAGVSLIEVILASSIFVLGVTSLVGMLLYGQEGTASGAEQTRAVFLAEEGVEAMRNIRDEAWNELAEGTGSVTVVGNEWTYTPGTEEVIDDFYTRTVLIEAACRDVLDQIAVCPASYTDPYTKKVTVSVSWEKRDLERSVERVTFLTNWASRNWVQTDWSGGDGQAAWSSENRYDSDMAVSGTEVSGQIGLTREGGIQTQAWTFDAEANYTFNTDEVEITGGSAQLKGSAVERTNEWPFDTGDNYTYDSQFITVSGGAARLVDLPENATASWTFDTESEYTYDPEKLKIEDGLARMKRIYDTYTEAMWHFDDVSGSSVFYDDTDNANHLTINGNPTLESSGQFDDAVYFDTNGDYGEIDDNDQTGLDQTGPFTIDVWVNKNSYTGTDYIVRKWTNGSGRSYLLRVRSNGSLQFYVQNGGTQRSITSPAGVVPQDAWVHVAAVYDGSYLRLFINGISVASPVSCSTGAQDGDAPFRVSYGGSSSFNGRIDDLRISSIARWTSNFTPPSRALGDFAVDDPIIQPTGSLSAAYADAWTSFTEDATKNGGEIYYQLSDDDGATWYYWDGGAWSAAGASDYSTAAEANANISSFPITSQSLTWRAFFSSDGDQEIILDTVSVGYHNSVSGYAMHGPSIYASDSFTWPEITAWTSFTEDATKNGGEIYYQLSDDDGATWYYWDGGAWSAAGASDYSTAAEIDENIADLSAANKKMQFKAFLESDGTQEVILSSVVIGYGAEPDEYTEGLWHLDESSGMFMDTSGNGNHLTPEGNPSYGITGHFDDAVRFDSNNDRGEIEDSAQMGLDITGQITIDAWAYRQADSTDYIAHKWTWGAGRSYRFYTLSNGRLRFEVEGDSSSESITSYNYVFNEDEWHHIAAVYDGSYLRLFVDGTSVADPVAYSGGIQDGDAPFMISDEGSSSFNGYLDEVRVSSIARWTSDFEVPTLPYSDVPQYASGAIVTPVTSIEAASVRRWSAFVEEAEKNGGEIYYQLSDDDGATWYYWDGGAWSAADPDEYNTAEEVHVHITDFPALSATLLAKIFFVGDGMQFIRLDTLRVAYASEGGEYYGNRVLLTDTDDTSRINNNNRKVSMRFTAQSTNTVDRIYFYQENYSGSSSFRVGLQADDGSGNPSGTYLGSDTYSSTNGWRNVNISPNVDIVEGEVYHIVIERDSGSGWRTYLYGDPDNDLEAFDSSEDLSSDVLWTSNGGGSWSEEGKQPIYILDFFDGHSEGFPYYTYRQDDSTYTFVYDRRQIGEHFTIEDGDKKVTSLGFYVRKSSSGTPEDDLYAVLYDMSLDEEVSSGVIATADEVTTSFKWYSFSFGENITLTEGHQYRVALASPGTSYSRAYDAYVMQTSNNSMYYNAGYKGILARYGRSTNDGGSWTFYNYYDLAFRMVDYGESSSTYAELGYLISSAFDMSDASPVQGVEWDEVVPVCTPDCEVYVQIRTAPDNGGTPGTWTDWYGAEGPGSFFDDASGDIVPSGVNGNQWMQYKVTLIGDGANTPTLEEIRINYR